MDMRSYSPVFRTVPSWCGPSCLMIMMFDYNTERWRRKRMQILRRDGYMCQHCKRYGRMRQATEVHHIKHVDEYPELAWDNNNLTSLCHACHNAEHPEKGRNGLKSRARDHY